MAKVRLNDRQLSHLREVFISVDYDKDGKIRSQDVGYVIRAVGLMPSKAEVDSMVQEINQGNGLVDLQGLVTMASRITSPDRVADQDFQDMFRLYDTNQSGTISVSAMRHLLTSVGDKLTEDEADQLMKTSGCIERNGMVNYAKLVQMITRETGR